MVSRRTESTAIEAELPSTDLATSAVSNAPPNSIQISIQGPFPKPDGAFNFRGWEKPECRYQAVKAYLRVVLADVFSISPQLVIESQMLHNGLYDISASAPPDQKSELRARFVEILKKELRIDVQIKSQMVSVYAMTLSASNSPGLKAMSKEGGGGTRQGGFYLTGSSPQAIASLFEYALIKPVIDETGLTVFLGPTLNGRCLRRN